MEFQFTTDGVLTIIISFHFYLCFHIDAGTAEFYAVQYLGALCSLIYVPVWLLFTAGILYDDPLFAADTVHSHALIFKW